MKTSVKSKEEKTIINDKKNENEDLKTAEDKNDLEKVVVAPVATPTDEEKKQPTPVEEKNDEEKKVMADINDYIKNYSDLTFEEYKQLKYGK